jgi:hypothetical protein
MVVLNGRFDGRKIILDDPIPKGIEANAPVRVIFTEETPSQTQPVLDRIARMARPGGLPPDFAEQHEHYVKGTPKK